jgi:general secretion pathway protein L
MGEFVVLRVRDPATGGAEWITVDAAGVCIGEVRYGDLDEVAETTAGSRVIALFPSFDVLRTETSIPIRNTSKLMKALPFAMEEQLAEDVDTLHFAIGQKSAEDRLPVAVVQRSKVDAWLESLAGAGLKLTARYAVGEALGDIPGTAILLIESDRATLRDTDGSVAVVDRPGLDTMIELWLAGQVTNGDEGGNPPINLIVYATPDAQEGLTEFAAAMQPRVDMLDVKLLADGALPRMASNIVANEGINLLQAAYASRSNLAMYWPAWRVAAVLLLTLSGAFIGLKTLEIVQINRQIAALDAAIEQSFRYTFPDVREVRDPRAQLQSKLRELGNGSASETQSQFLDTLQTVSVAVAKQKDVNAKLETINYRGGVMELRLLAPNVESLDTIQKAISQNGNLSAEIQSANPEGNQVMGRLQIKRPGA